MSGRSDHGSGGFRRTKRQAFLYMTGKVGNVLRGFLQAYGTEGVKRSLWNGEFTEGHWQCLERSPGDPVYFYIEKYADKGSILDLGCGSGSTGNELDATTYKDYTGVDISDVAIEQAKVRSAENQRADKNTYLRSDIFSYAPTQQFDVILLRDSVYYIPWAKIKGMLDRYTQHLKKDGVFVVRMWSINGKYKTIVDAIENNFDIVEKQLSEQPSAVIMVFRSRTRP